MARIDLPRTPGTTDPFGNGTQVADVLSPWTYKDTDPFLLLHELGPTWKTQGESTGGRRTIHPHRGFCECPYKKFGELVGLDYWNPDGGHHPPRKSGAFQWGKAGCGIMHGMRNDGVYEGWAHDFQLWVNLPAREKMDRPCFQDSEPEALPWIQVSDKVQVKCLVGESSPVDTGGVSVQYFDYELKAGGEVVHNIPFDYSTVFVYIYTGAGSFGSTGEVAGKGKVFRVHEAAGKELRLVADQGVDLGLLLLAGVPLREPCVQHGPFVMSTRDQLRQAFEDYQNGVLCPPACDYVLHTAEGSVRTQCKKQDA